MSLHALLSASASHRWLACPPSVRFTENMESGSSIYAEEGTHAHDVAAAILCYRIIEEPWVDSEMLRCAGQYADYVKDLKEAGCTMMVEEMIFYDAWAQDGFGTADCVVITADTLHVIDYKYGKGIFVEADHNPQMTLYALGVINKYVTIYEFDKVSLHIFQPRLGGASRWDTTVDELLQIGEEIRPIAALAFAGEGDFAVGDHCRFCPGKMVCPARNGLMSISLEELETDVVPGTLTPEVLADTLPKLERIENWAKDVREYALKTVLSGQQIPGYKVVEGRSNRRYTDPAAVARAITAEWDDMEPVIYKRELLGITEMEKLLGKKDFKRVVGELVEKPVGKPALVSQNDPRPIFNSIETDFQNVNYEED